MMHGVKVATANAASSPTLAPPGPCTLRLGNIFHSNRASPSTAQHSITTYSTAAMAAPQSLELAKTLPPRLLRFFQRYPPPQLFPSITSQIAATPTETPTPDLAPAPTTDAASPPAAPTAPEAAPTPADLAFPNPFQPTKNHTTGRWHSPVYGLRKQADLVKLATSYGVVDLLPWTIKKPGEKEARRIERGLSVKGTGVGQRVKGKLWERTLKGRMEMRRQAMLDMPRLVQEWKQVCLVLVLRVCRAGGLMRSRKGMEGGGRSGRVVGRRSEAESRAGEMGSWCVCLWVGIQDWLHERFGMAFGPDRGPALLYHSGDACTNQTSVQLHRFMSSATA